MNYVSANLLPPTRNLHICLRYRRIFPHHLLWYTRFLLLVDASRTRREECVVQIRQLLALGRPPMFALPWRYVQDIHIINFLQTSAVRLAYEEVDHHCAGEAARSKDVTITVVDGGRDIRCKETDEKIPDPITGDLVLC